MKIRPESCVDPIWAVLADHPGLCREGLQRLLEQPGPVTLAGVTGDPGRLRDEAKRLSAAVVLLGDDLPGVQDGHMFAQLGKLRPACRTLVLTRVCAPRYVRHLLDAGAGGVFHRGDSYADLLRALTAVCSGQLHLSPALAGLCVMRLAGDKEREPIDTLSRREFETVLLLARGFRVKEVARQLALSVRTVSTYRQRAFEKLQVDSLPALGRYALEAGLMAPSDTSYTASPQVRQTAHGQAAKMAVGEE